MYLENGIVTKNEKLNDRFFHLACAVENIAREIICGQFVFIKINDSHEPLLRRPFSVAWVGKNEINIVYKVVGRGTTLLAEKNKGDVLDIMGPLGNGFSFDEEREAILVAGGIGIASLVALSKMCVRPGLKLFYGAKTKSECVDAKFLSVPQKNITYATEDGSAGEKGLITEVLEEYLHGAQHMIQSHFIYTCGPLPMIRTVVTIAHTYGINGEANLEERMACGVGACLGCAVETAQGIKMVCKDGPVFTFKELGWT